MLLAEILNKDEQLDEGKFKNAIAAGTIAAASMIPSHLTPTGFDVGQQARTEYRHKIDAQALVGAVKSKYKTISTQFAQHVVSLAEKYAKPTFPSAADILAIVGIESSFDPSAISGLKHDPAVGLMQVRPKIWNISPQAIKHSTDAQIQLGSAVLNKYYKKLGSKEDAVHAYNVGLRNFITGNRINPEYVARFKKELALYI